MSSGVEAKTYDDLSPEEKAEYDERNSPEALLAYKAEGLRRNRDDLMARFQWRLQRHAREIRLGLTPTDNIADLDAYMQALADITEQPGFPDDITWPTEP